MTLLFQVYAFAFGAVVGSFLNVCILRWPREKSIVRPRSRCSSCGHQLEWFENVPIFSWLFLRGRCRYCSASITPRYLVVELLTGGLFLLCYWHFGLTLATLKCAVLGFLLLGLILTDAETHLLPDKLTLPGLGAGLVFSWFVPVNDLMSLVLPGVVQLPLSSDVSWRLFSFFDSLLGVPKQIVAMCL